MTLDDKYDVISVSLQWLLNGTSLVGSIDVGPHEILVKQHFIKSTFFFFYRKRSKSPNLYDQYIRLCVTLM